MKIFISHSTKDSDVAKKFKNLFVKYGDNPDVFLSSDMRRSQIEVKQWKLNLQRHLKKCDFFVVLESPNSLNSQWVQYEIGFAEACVKKSIISIGIKGVSPEKSLLSDIDVKVVEKEDHLIGILGAIFGGTDGAAKEWCKNNIGLTNELIELCKERCVYFVGNEPEDNGKWNQDFVDDFLKKITIRLIEKGIKVSSFPKVAKVGKKVWEAVSHTQYTNLYEISGLYDFDKLLENEDLDEQNTWRKILKGFRKLYLKNKSSMIIIGGGTHTKEEYDVAHREFKQIEIFPLPCMGGFAEELFKQNRNKYLKSNHPCCGCNNVSNGTCGRINEFEKRLGQFIFIDEDERES